MRRIAETPAARANGKAAAPTKAPRRRAEEVEPTAEPTPEFAINAASTMTAEPAPDIAMDAAMAAAVEETPVAAAGETLLATEEAPPEATEEALPATTEETPPLAAAGETARPRGRFTTMRIEDLQAKYLEVVGRATGSDDRRYLSVKISEAERGLVPVGPRPGHTGEPAQ